jgi:hypothetical protein
VRAESNAAVGSTRRFLVLTGSEDMKDGFWQSGANADLAYTSPTVFNDFKAHVGAMYAGATAASSSSTPASC